jgi:hypothetical protein
MTDQGPIVPAVDANPEKTTSDDAPTKRRNLGRQARRRRKKVLEIEAAAAAAANKTSSEEATTATSTVVLATDRHYVWPAVKELTQLSKEEEVGLSAQLGYLPGNALRVAATASKIISNDESPLVVELYPLVLRDESDGTKSRRKRKRTNGEGPLMEPFPTTYWITHARIRALISKLELDRWGQKIEGRLQEDAEARTSMRQAHEEYAKKRYGLITEKDRAWIKERGWDSAFAVTRGVAGIRNPESVKCLHAHAAHFWSGCEDNVVGKWVAEEIDRMLKPKTEEATGE